MQNLPHLFTEKTPVICRSQSFSKTLTANEAPNATTYRHKSIDMWKIHKHVKMYAPVKLSEDGKAYAFDKAKRNLAQGASREEYSAHETVMRQADPWYDLAKKEVTAADVWSAETGFENFMKRLTKEGYGEAADAIKSTLAKLKKDGKLRKLAEKAQEEVGEASY